MVSKTQFQFSILLCLGAILSALAIMFYLQPEIKQVPTDEISFTPRQIEFAEEPADLSFLKNKFLQGKPISIAKQEPKKTEKQKPVPKFPMPSEKVVLTGVLYDSNQPQNAKVFLSSSNDNRGFGVGEKLPGEFANWTIESITTEFAIVINQNQRDKITRTTVINN